MEEKWQKRIREQFKAPGAPVIPGDLNAVTSSSTTVPSLDVAAQMLQQPLPQEALKPTTSELIGIAQ